MALLRNGIQDFELANPLYKGATVTFYAVDVDGVKTTTKATLYATPVGTATLANPQALGADGKFIQPVYVEEDVIISVSGLTIPDHDTGIINLLPLSISALDVHNAADKATPADTDELGIVDSASSWSMKKLTWANLKATLKTYFDPIYTSIANLAASSGSSLIGFLQAGTGAVARTLQDKERDSVSVKDFGAVGDGVTDDTAAIQTAITVNAGKIINGKSGDIYAISSAITIPVAGITFNLNGATILHNAGALHSLFIATGSSNIIFRNGKIDGNHTNVTTAAARWSRPYAIYFTTCTNILFEEVELVGHRGGTFYGTGCTRVKLLNNWIHDCDNWGAVFSAETDIVYSGNHVENVFTHGLYVDGASGSGSLRVRILGNTTINCQYDAAYVGSGIGISLNCTALIAVSDIEISDNTSMNNGNMGFSLTPGNNSLNSRMIVSGNIASSHTANFGYGFELQGTDLAVDGNISYNNKYGAVIQRCTNLLLSNNNIKAIGATQLCIIVQPATANAADAVSNLTVIGNQLVGGIYGIQVTTTAAPHANFNICNNSFINNDSAITMQSSVASCKVSGNQIDVSSSSTTTLGRGIGLFGTGLIVDGNQIKCRTGSNQSGVYLLGASADLTITNNTLLAGDYGISFSSVPTLLIVGANNMAAAAVAQTPNFNYPTTLIDRGDNSWNYGTTAPASASWRIGQKVWNTAVVAGGSPGWICTTSGVPGTWKTMAAVSA